MSAFPAWEGRSSRILGRYISLQSHFAQAKMGLNTPSGLRDLGSLDLIRDMGNQFEILENSSFVAGGVQSESVGPVVFWRSRGVLEAVRLSCFLLNLWEDPKGCRAVDMSSSVL